MSNPFSKITKAAEDTKNDYQFQHTKEETSADIRTCHNCGAPRPRSSNLVVCAYCGTKFMDIDEDIKPNE